MPVNPNKVANLRKLVEVTAKKAKVHAGKSKGASMALRGSRGTNFAEDKRSFLLGISLNHKNPNQALAKKVIFILDKARAGDINPPSGSPETEHQILTNIANAILKSRKGQVVKLNQNQLRVLEDYYTHAQRSG